MKMVTARVMPLPGNQRDGLVSFLADDAAVVLIVNVALPELALLIETGDVVPKLRVGGYCAPLGDEVMDALSVTLPVKPFAGCTVIVEMFPLVAPFVTVTPVPDTPKVGGGRVIVYAADATVLCV